MDRTPRDADGNVIREGNLTIEENTSGPDLIEYGGSTGASGTTTGGTASGTSSGTSSSTSSSTTTSGISTGGVTTDVGTSGVSSEPLEVPVSDGPSTMQAGSSLLGGLSTTETETTVVEDTSAGEVVAEGRQVEGALAGRIDFVRENMQVVDAAGDELGKVSYVKMGDPQAITTQGEEMGGDAGLFSGGLFGGGGDNEPDVAEPFRSELLREGFVKVGGGGFFGKDRYIRPSLIADVSGDMVRLNVTKDRIIEDTD